MKLYFGNAVTTVTTIMILALLGFIGYSVWNRENISFWGRRSAFLLIYGLVVCCFAAARDGLDKTIQCAIDVSCAPRHLSPRQRSYHCRLCRRAHNHRSRHRDAHR